jgi:mono/diheme cytochrome c family protein
MARAFLILVVLAVIGLATAVWLVWPNAMTQDEALASLPADFAGDPIKGEVLFYTAGCGSCHMNEQASADKPEGLVGGKGLETPFGTFYPSNITPDPETGIGGWSETQFLNALQRGLRPDGLPYYPALPYTAYAKASAEDLLHIKAYLDEQDPVAYQAPEHQLAFPANIRLGVGAFKKLLVDFSPFEPDPGQSDAWNRGAYLTQALGHCGFCHTPRTPWQTEDQTRAFQGAPALKAGEKAAKKLVDRKPGVIIDALSSDAIDLFAVISDKSAMAHVSRAYDHVPDADKQAIETYILSFAP